ncbi:hypothetical protein V6N13_091048 [Hibiscus sabdariffa]
MINTCHPYASRPSPPCSPASCGSTLNHHVPSSIAVEGKVIQKSLVFPFKKLAPSLPPSSPPFVTPMLLGRIGGLGHHLVPMSEPNNIVGLSIESNQRAPIDPDRESGLEPKPNSEA